MNFFEYYQPGEVMENAVLTAALELIDMGFKVLPCDDQKNPTKRAGRTNKMRVRPINKENAAFYLDDVANLAVFTGEGNLEVIDIDCKYDLTGNLYRNICLAIKYSRPEIWDKLVIQRSKSGGYHFWYKCGQIGGNDLLAARYTTPEELEKGERKKTLVETRGTGGYIMCCPSPGYEFVKGNPAEVKLISPDERDWLFAVCASFDKIGQPELDNISSAAKAKEDAPWNVYNRKNGYEEVQRLLEASQWEVIKDDAERVYVLRPGGTAALSATIWKESGTLYVFSTSTEFTAQKPYSPFGVFCQLKFNGDVKAAALYLAEQGIGKWAEQDGEFYEINNDGKVVIKHMEIVQWMQDIGIRKLFLSKTDYQLVHIINNVVTIIDNQYIKKLFFDYISCAQTPQGKKIPDNVINKFLSSLATLFSEQGIINVVNAMKDNFLRSTKTKGYLFFKNTVVEVTGNDAKTVDYAKIEGYVWEKNIIQRDYIIKNADCFAAKFIKNISGNHDGKKEQKELSFRCGIGYALHAYKDPADPKVIILTDEFMDEQKDTEPEGGTGKGMYIQLLSQFKNVCPINGKGFEFDKSFAYQRVGHDTEIVAFEDVKRKFDFEKLFSVITEGWTVEKKGQPEFTIPFDRSPKIIITSNYAIKGTSASHRRRRFELEVYPYYNPEFTIKKEFGHIFFKEWDESQWACFDCFMIECLQIYLSSGIVQAPTLNLSKKRLAEETNREFVIWMDGLKEARTLPHGRIHKTEFLNRFTKDFPDFSKLSQAWFTKWIKKWCDFNGFGFDPNNRLGENYAYDFTHPTTEENKKLPEEPPF